MVNVGLGRTWRRSSDDSRNANDAPTPCRSVASVRCHVCNADVGENQRFCHECGESLRGVTDTTEALDMQAVFESAEADDAPVADAAEAEGDAPVEGEDDATVVAGTLGAAGAAGVVAAAAEDDATVAAAALADGGPATAEVGLGEAGDMPDIWATPTGDQAVTSTPPEATQAVASPEPAVAAAAAPDATVARSEPVAAHADATTTMAPVPPAAGVYGATDEYGAVPPGVDPGATTDPYLFDAAHDFDRYPPESEPFRFRMTVVIGVLAALTVVLCAFADITDVRTDRVVPGIENRLRTLDDIGSNLSIAGFIGAAIMLIGGVLHCFNLRWGAGLAGGAGLALAGWAAVTIGLAEVPLDQARRITAESEGLGVFVLTITRDVGYWLVIGVGVLGIAAFVFSLVSSGTGGRAGLDPWTAAVGALGGVVAAAGPLVPVANATFSSNFGVNDLPTAFFAGRLIQVALLGGSVMVGFLLVRRYGLGLAAGGLSIPTFMWLTTLIDLGDAPIGVAVGNLGTSDISPHAVTTVGMVVALSMLLVAGTIAAVRRDR